MGKTYSFPSFYGNGVEARRTQVVITPNVDRVFRNIGFGPDLSVSLEQPSTIGVVAAEVLKIWPGVGNNIPARAGGRRL